MLLKETLNMCTTVFETFTMVVETENEHWMFSVHSEFHQQCCVKRQEAQCYVSSL
jgi:hypothetical protein